MYGFTMKPLEVKIRLGSRAFETSVLSIRGLKALAVGIRGLRVWSLSVFRWFRVSGLGVSGLGCLGHWVWGFRFRA